MRCRCDRGRHGGRYDATNVVMPRVSVISTAHYDHTRVLGETLDAIAFHKAGIIKPGVPVVVGDVADVACKLSRRRPHGARARTIRLGRDIHYQPIELTRHGGRFTYHGLKLTLEDATVGLLGQHQLANAALALDALELYAEAQGFELDEAALRRGLANACFAGRLEVMQTNPLAVLDGAHNQEKIGALLAAIPQVFDYNRLILVLGMLEAKTVEPIMQALAPLADEVVTTYPKVKGQPAILAADLADLARAAGVSRVEAEPVPLAALERGLALPGRMTSCSSRARCTHRHGALALAQRRGDHYAAHDVPRTGTRSRARSPVTVALPVPGNVILRR